MLRRIGLTGASGGGLNALFTAAVEDRFACAIPVAYPCTFSLAMQAERDLNWEDGTDVCNQVPQVMSYAEMSDLASLFIPRPYMILAGTPRQDIPHCRRPPDCRRDRGAITTCPACPSVSVLSSTTKNMATSRACARKRTAGCSAG